MQMRSKKYCNFFNTLYQSYCKKNPDELTPTQFLENLTPDLIERSKSLELLADVLIIKITDMAAQSWTKLIYDKLRYDKLVEVAGFANHSYEYDYFLALPNYIQQHPIKLAACQAALKSVKETGTITPDQTQTLKTYMEEFRAPRTILLFNRIFELAKPANSLGLKCD